MYDHEFMMERQEGEGGGGGLDLGGTSAGGGTGISLKGTGLVPQNRAVFKKDPERKLIKLEEKIKDKLSWEAGDNWSVETYMSQVPWGTQRGLKRSCLMLAKIHNTLRSDQPDLALVRGLVPQAVKVTVQAAMDAGN